MIEKCNWLCRCFVLLIMMVTAVVSTWLLVILSPCASSNNCTVVIVVCSVVLFLDVLVAVWGATLISLQWGDGRPRTSDESKALLLSALT